MGETLMTRWIQEVVGVALAGALSAGCCGGGSSSSCSAKLTYQGVTVPGAGDNQQKAQQGACWKYCGDHDPSVQAAYNKWKASGGKSKGDKFFDLADVPELRRVRTACEAQCNQDVASGKGSISYSNCK
jgi:hypothetical protein